MKKERQKFTKEFKIEAVRLTNESGKTIRQVAVDLGIAINTLTRWRKEFRSNVGEAFRGNGKRTEEQEQLWRLERENETLRRERDILKKVLAIVSQP